MGVRKITVSIPEDLAEELTRRVPARDRSKYVAKAVRESLEKSENRLTQACLMANRDQDAQAIEHEFDAVADPIAEPWNDPTER